ncbi:hypothetical protein H0H92_003208, partial [Tricholoma furcatifolium]
LPIGQKPSPSSTRRPAKNKSTPSLRGTSLSMRPRWRSLERMAHSRRSSTRLEILSCTWRVLIILLQTGIT